MVVCQFFLRGHCKYGTSCRNEHPQNQQTAGFGSGSQTRNQTWQAGNVAMFNTDSIVKDLTPQVDKPLWPLSSYGPAKYEPVLIPNLDESQEELRVRAQTALKAGAPNDYLKYETEKIVAAEQIFTNARNNASQVYNQALNQSRLSSEAIKPPSAFGGSTPGSVFGAAAPASTSVFGQPSPFRASGATTNAFGSSSSVVGGTTPAASVFGSATAPTSAFGKPSFGQSAFGTSTSVFGQPSQPKSVFGQSPQQAPVFGQPSQPTSAFGQPSQPTSAFGQSTSTFGQLAQPTSAFGQPSQPTSAFSQPQQTPAFGQTSQPTSSFIKPASGAFGSGTGVGAFGTSSTTQSPFGVAPAAPSPFSSTGTTTGAAGGFSAFAGRPSAFGVSSTVAPAQSGGSVFGQPSFGQPSTTSTSVLDKPAPVPSSTTSAFGAPSAFGALAQQTPGPFSAFSSVSNQAGSAFGSSAPSAFGTATQVSAFQPSTQRVSAFDSTPEKPMSTSVFQSTFRTSQPTPSSSLAPKPPPRTPDFSNAKRSYNPSINKYDLLLPENYAQLIPEAARKEFESKRFTWGKVPECVPPKEVR